MKRFWAAVVIAAVLAAVVQVSRKGAWTESFRVPSFRQRGTDSPRVRITVFSDFQCPNCAKAHPFLDDLARRYEKDVRLAFRHYPLKHHTWAFPAARAAESAGVQGKFWEYMSLLYARQKDWAESPDAPSLFAAYAAELGLDAARFAADMQSGRWDGPILADREEAQARGVNSTPTFFINERRIAGETQLREYGERFILLELEGE